MAEIYYKTYCRIYCNAQLEEKENLFIFALLKPKVYKYEQI